MIVLAAMEDAKSRRDARRAAVALAVLWLISTAAASYL
jgi:hypothetical protein